MKDRVPTYPGRVTLTPVSGVENTYDMTRADEPEEEGTPLTKGNLLSDATAQLLGFDITTDDPSVDDALLKVTRITSGAVGEIICSVSTDLGDNWHVCDGSLLDQSAYTDLASAMDGNVYGNAFYNTSWILPDTTPTALYSGGTSRTFSDYVHSGVIDVCMYGSTTFTECTGLAVLVEGSATYSSTTYQTVCIYYIDDISGMTQDEISDLNNYTAMPRAFICLVSSRYTDTLLYHAKLSYANSSLVLVMSCDRNSTDTSFGHFYRYTVSDGAISTSYSYTSLTSSTSSYGWNVLDVNYSSTYSTYYIIAASRTSNDASTVYCLHFTFTTVSTTFSAENALSSVTVSGTDSELVGMCSPLNDTSFCIVSVSSGDVCYIYRYALASATTVSSGTSLSYDNCTNFYIAQNATGTIYIIPYYTYYGSLSTTHYTYYHVVYFNKSSIGLLGSGNTSGINTTNTLSGFLVGQDSDSGSTTCFPLLTFAYDTGGCIAYNTAVSTSYDASTWDVYGCSNSGFSGAKTSGVPAKIFLDGNEYMANTSGIMATFPTHLKLPNMKLQTALNISDSYYGYLQELSEVYINNEKYYIRVK